MQIKNLRPGDPTAKLVAEPGSVLGFLLASMDQVVAGGCSVRLVGVGISASFLFIRSLGATSFLEHDYMFLKLNSLLDI